MLTQRSTRLRFWHQLWGLLPVSNVGKEANSKINVKKSLLINLSIINSPQKYAQSVEKIFTVPVNVNPELIMMEGNPVLGKERMSPKGAHGDTRKPPLFPSWNPHCPCSTSAWFMSQTASYGLCTCHPAPSQTLQWLNILLLLLEIIKDGLIYN